MDVAKRLDFDPTDTLPGLQDASQQRFHSADLAALQDLQQAVQDLSVATKQKQAHILALARQTAEQGIGDNDLKRLQRQFDSNKSTFINIDQKQRFMKGLWDIEVDIEQLTAVKDEQEQLLERGSEALRRIKAQNEQARQRVAGTSASISQTYTFVEQATEATAAQLESTKLVLQQHAAKQPLLAEAPLEPGPEQDEAQQLVEAETAQAKELERSIAAAEAALSELEVQAAADRQQLASLRAEVEHMEVLAATRAKAADADKHTKDATAWCEGVMAMVANTTGLAVVEASSSQLVLGITVCVPSSRQGAATKPPREMQHQLVLRLQQRPSNAAAASSSCTSKGGPAAVYGLASARLSPSCVDVSDLVEAAAAVKGSIEGVTYLVREVRGRLLAHWQRKVLVEAAAEVYPPGRASRGPPHVSASLGNQVEVEVLVPLSWPCDAAEVMQVVQLTAPGWSSEAVDALIADVNADQELLAGCDVLGLLQHVSEVVDQQLLDAAAAAAGEAGGDV